MIRCRIAREVRHEQRQFLLHIETMIHMMIHMMIAMLTPESGEQVHGDTP